jgi:hypothetical protein
MNGNTQHGDNKTPPKRDRDRATKTQVTERRREVVKLLQQNRGQDLEFETIVKYLKLRDLPASPRILQRLGEEIRLRLEAGMELRVGRSSMSLTAAEDSVYESRKGDNPEVKRLLARAAWFHLFGYGTDVPVEESTLHVAESPHATENIVTKISKLNELSVITLIIDAGTTTAEFGRCIIKASGMPLMTQVGTPFGGAKAGKHTRALIPRVLSNSQHFSQEVYRCHHREDFEFMLIGGTLRPKHGAYCGPLSMMALDAWGGLRGDVAIIGSTGYREGDERDSAGFSCANYHESQMKAALLKKAKLRAIILDSSKLVRPIAANLFVPLAAYELDLVILDDGVKINAGEAVQRFKQKALEAGVAVLLVKTEAEEPRHGALMKKDKN